MYCFIYLFDLHLFVFGGQVNRRSEDEEYGCFFLFFFSRSNCMVLTRVGDKCGKIEKSERNLDRDRKRSQDATAPMNGSRSICISMIFEWLSWRCVGAPSKCVRASLCHHPIDLVWSETDAWVKKGQIEIRGVLLSDHHTDKARKKNQYRSSDSRNVTSRNMLSDRNSIRTALYLSFITGIRCQWQQTIATYSISF